MIKFIWMTKNNWEIIRNIKREVFKDDMIKDFEDDIFEKVAYKKIDGYTYNNFAYLENENNEKVGLAGYYSKDEENMWLNWYGIIDKYRRKGYGKETILKLEDYIRNNFKDMKYLRLYTGEEDNKDAIKLYKRLGYEQERGYYSEEGEDDLVILGKSLKNIPYEEWNREPIW